jgi:hypothetical protein
VIEDPTLPLGISGSSAATLYLALHDAMHRIARCKHQVVSTFIKIILVSLKVIKLIRIKTSASSFCHPAVMNHLVCPRPEISKAPNATWPNRISHSLRNGSSTSTFSSRAYQTEEMTLSLLHSIVLHSGCALTYRSISCCLLRFMSEMPSWRCVVCTKATFLVWSFSTSCYFLSAWLITQTDFRNIRKQGLPENSAIENG